MPAVALRSVESYEDDLESAWDSRWDDPADSSTQYGAGSEAGAPEARFRIVTRKPLPPASRRRTSPVRNVTLLAALPAFFLILYVFSWTAAVKGGYYKGSLQSHLEELRVEQADLEADLRRLQAPGVIFSRAESLGMRSAEDRRFVQIPREPAPTDEGTSRL